MSIMAADAKMIWAWAATHCTENETLPEDMALFLGFEGVLYRDGDFVEVQPAPEGTKRVLLRLRGEVYEGLEAEIESVVPVAALEPYLGSSHALDDGRVGFRLVEAKGSNACVVTARVENGLVKEVVLRREPLAPVVAAVPVVVVTAPAVGVALVVAPGGLHDSVAFLLGFGPKEIFAHHAAGALLAKLAADPRAKGDPKLTHALSFKSGCVDLSVELAVGKLEAELLRHSTPGVTLPAWPIDAPGWGRFDAILQEELARSGDVEINLAYVLGRRARDLYAAWAMVRELKYLSASNASHPAVTEAAEATVARIAETWTALARKLQGAPALEKKRRELEEFAKKAPGPDALIDPQRRVEACVQADEWLHEFARLLGDIWMDLPAVVAAHEVRLKANAPLPVDEFLKRAPELAASGALSKLKLAGAGGRVAEIAGVPELANVMTLEMIDQQITDADLQALAASPHVGGLRLLRVDQNEIRAAGVEALAAAASTNLRSLEAVGMDLNHVSSPADRMEFYDEYNQHCVPTEEGMALEAKYGRIKWLHPHD